MAKPQLEPNERPARDRKILIAYGPHRRVQQTFPPGEGRTKQEFKDESDINIIMKRYERTGVLEYVQKHEPQYLDITGHDFQTAMDTIADARTAFNELPARVRSHFNNDPGEFLDAVHDEDRRGELADLGLLSEAATTAYRQAQAASEEPPPSSGSAAPSKGASQAASKPAAPSAPRKGHQAPTPPAASQDDS